MSFEFRQTHPGVDVHPRDGMKRKARSQAPANIEKRRVESSLLGHGNHPRRYRGGIAKRIGERPDLSIQRGFKARPALRNLGPCQLRRKLRQDRMSQGVSANGHPRSSELLQFRLRQQAEMALRFS